MRSIRTALLAVSAPLVFSALTVACSEPELASDLVVEGPPEVVEVNVLSEASALFITDPTAFGLFAGEEATFCRPGDEYKVHNVFCPEARDAENKPIPGDRAKDPVLTVMPYGPALGFSSIWHARFIFDELIDPSVEDIVDGRGTLAGTQPAVLTCNGVDVAYDGFYDPSGNHLSYPPGPALVIQATEFVATGSSCEVSLKSGAVTDKDGEAVPADQLGPYEFAIAALQLYGSDPVQTFDDDDNVIPTEGVDPTAELILEFNSSVDPATAVVTLVDDADVAVPFTLGLLVDVEPVPNLIAVTPDAPLDPLSEYTLTFTSIDDIGGGSLTLDEPYVVPFVTGETPPPAP